MSERPEYMDMRQVCQWCSLSTRTIQRMIENGLPAYRVGKYGKILVKPADIEAWLVKKVKGEGRMWLVEQPKRYHPRKRQV